MQRTLAIRRSVAVLAITAAIIVGGLTASVAFDRSHASTNVPIFVSSAQAAADPALPFVSFSPVVKRSAPAVVNISSTKVIKASSQQQQRRGRNPQQENPMLDDPFFRQFFGDQFGNMVPRDRRESGAGSGVIVSPDGYILTNNHVVDGATTVKVSLSDKREFTAKIIGTDPQSDVAVIKIDAANLPTLPLSGIKPEIGDVCLAIGNPFGVGQTVTMGIVGATSRSTPFRIEQFEDFIQTDAAINPGNSGGALINTRGELIGINTAILPGNTGGNIGIGFAIPVTMARNVMDQLIKSGKVTRGYIGATLQELDPNLARSFKLPTNSGAVITEVTPGAPAEKGGLKQGDVVTQLEGQSISGQAELRNRIATMTPGTTVNLQVYRDGEPRNVKLTLGERPADLDSRGTRRNSAEPGASKESPLEGVSVEELDADTARQLGIAASTKGVVVTDVSQASSAAEAGLRQGDVVEQVNRQPVRTVDEFERAVSKGKGTTLLSILRGGGRLFIAIENK